MLRVQKTSTRKFERERVKGLLFKRAKEANFESQRPPNRSFNGFGAGKALPPPQPNDVAPDCPSLELRDNLGPSSY